MSNTKAKSAKHRTIQIPSRAFLEKLPQDMRGDKWRDDEFPPEPLEIAADSLLAQLSTGKVILDIADYRSDFVSSGWLRPDASGPVEIDLAPVVQAVPRELLEPTGRKEENILKSARIPELFSPEDSLLDTFQTERGGSGISIPAKVALVNLPESQRGPAWREDSFPECEFQLNQRFLMTQLQRGRVAVEISDIASELPEGWLRQDASGEVTFNIAEVVAAVPEELLETRGTEPEMPEMIESMPDFFHPAGFPSDTQSAQPASPTEASDTGSPSEKAGADEDSESGTGAELDTERWDGIEPGIEYAPLGIDVNRCDAKTLADLDGIGLGLAEDIIAYRDRRGPFSSIFDLLEIPGIGPAVFKKITGISLKSRANRHHVVRSLLELPTEKGPLPVRIAEGISKMMNGRGCVLTDREGNLLAATESVRDKAERYSTLGANFVSVTSGPVESSTDDAPGCVMLPGRKPPILLVSDRATVLVIILEDNSVPSAKLERVQEALPEITWVLSRRAVVLK